MRNPRRALQLRLWDILNAINTARLAVSDLSVDGFRDDPIRKFAAERSIEIISEASRHIPGELKDAASHLPWNEILGIGNVLRHGYDIVDPEIIWKLTRDDLGPLEATIRQMLDEIEGS